MMLLMMLMVLMLVLGKCPRASGLEQHRTVEGDYDNAYIRLSPRSRRSTYEVRTVV